jgi:katanin p80 WD40 repeat-containing subunit B1
MDRNITPAVKASIHGISTAERNIGDDRSMGSGNYESDSTTEPPTSYQEENCKCYPFKKNSLPLIVSMHV